jgi:hypothetical protein
MKALDLTEQRFGMLTAKHVVSTGKKRVWLCVCDCGNEVEIPTFQLTAGNNSSCGCGRSQVKAGMRYGSLFVQEVMYAQKAKKDDRLSARCLCDCGNQKTLHTRNLTRGSSTHCGCKLSENKSKASRGEYGLSLRNKVIASYKSNAIQKGLEFSLTNEHMIELFASRCHYCGDEPSKTMTLDRFYGSFTYNGIDRLDSSKGYIESNVVTACSVCNYLKNDYSKEHFLSLI